MCVLCAKSFQSYPTLCDPWTVACQAPLESSRQEYWSRLWCPPPGDLPDPGIKLTSLMPPALAGRFFIISATREVLSQLYFNFLKNLKEKLWGGKKIPKHFKNHRVRIASNLEDQKWKLRLRDSSNWFGTKMDCIIQLANSSLRKQTHPSFWSATFCMPTASKSGAPSLLTNPSAQSEFSGFEKHGCLIFEFLT